MSRKILLIEPNYANKYPPIGLMKIAQYHRILGDDVRFFKGNLTVLAAELVADNHLSELSCLVGENLPLQLDAIRQFIRLRRPEMLTKIELNDESKLPALTELLLKLSSISRNRRHQDFPKFDRVYVTTLFTFYWPITIRTIKFAKHLVRNKEDLLVGGILATLMEPELRSELGIEPVVGLLDKPGQLDPDLPEAQKLIVDDLPLDYSILDEIDYQYPTRSAYFTFMTKGCTRKCSFCSVPVLEPTYQSKIETIGKFDAIRTKYGEQQNLLLMDNNVLASPNFHQIIDEIKDMGFEKGAKYIEPNQLDIAVENLAAGHNVRGMVRRIYRLLRDLTPRLKGDEYDRYMGILEEYHLVTLPTVTASNLLAAYPRVKGIYEKNRSKTARSRFVDFNQGTDCRYVTPTNMAKMAEIPIRPLRIAFDHISLRKQYESAVRLAAANDINVLSNYILYNFNDKPDDLWLRLRVNVDLCRELGIEIFSFPMKYIPLFGEEAKSRKYIGKHWNRKFIRAVQSILNVTKGIVAPATKAGSTTFFEEAFGQDLSEFRKILFMPENYIVYRKLFRDAGYTEIWWREFEGLKKADQDAARAFIKGDNFSEEAVANAKLTHPVLRLLRHYRVPRTTVLSMDKDYKRTKEFFDRMIKSDQFIDLTLTYDFESSSRNSRRGR